LFVCKNIKVFVFKKNFEKNISIVIFDRKMFFIKDRKIINVKATINTKNKTKVFGKTWEYA